MLRCDSSSGLGKSRFVVIHSSIEMKPLKPIIKYPLAILLAAIVLAPGIKTLTEDAGKEAKKQSAQMDKFNANMEKMRAQNNNR
jgi:hypothetical protein